MTTYIKKSFRDASGVRHYVRGRTLEEAIIKREELKKKLASEGMARSSSALFKDWAVIALDTYKADISHKQRVNIDSRLKNYINPVIGNMPIGKITPLQCQVVVNQGTGKSRSFITSLSQELSFYFDAARKNGMIPKNPAEDIIRPKGYNNKRRSLTPAEREAFIKIAKKHKRFRLFELMLYCGCRPNEAVKVKYEDVVQIDGVSFLHIRGTKTENSDRFVPIPKEVSAMLCKKRLRGCVALTEAGTPHGEKSYRRLTKRLYREMNIALGAKTYRNQIVVPALADDFVPYLFRHTYCTDLKKKGVDVRIAKDLMGHADIKTTANIYDHSDGDTLLLAAKQMGIA